MNLSDTIYAQAQVLPIDLQREALDFITYLQQRHHITPPISPVSNHVRTEAFIQRFSGSVRDDFSDDIGATDLASDVPRESLE